MKTLLFLFLLSVLTINTIFSNPIIPPAKITISEIYFSSKGWVLEVVADGSYQNDNLDSVVIETSSGKSYFKSGITFVDKQILLITADSLKTPLSINSMGDFIYLKEEENGHLIWGWDGAIKFGNYTGSTCSAPFSGQSLSVVKGWAWVPDPFGGNTFYEPQILTKMNLPTLGSDPFTNSEKDTIKGFILDMHDKPINKVKIWYLASYRDYIAFGLPLLETDANGYFEGKLYAANYNNVLILINDSVYKNVNLKVELDSANFYTIKIENYTITNSYKLRPAVADYRVRTFPNPAKKVSTFEISIPSIASFKKAIIKLYNGSGQIIEILPVSPANKSNLISVNWYIKDNLPDGEYFYSLEVDNRRVKSDKIIVSR